MNKIERLELAFDTLKAKRKVKDKGHFAKKLGYGRTYLSDLTSGNKPISDKFAKKLEEEFEINSNWLINGTGDMFIKNPEDGVVRINTNAQMGSVNEADEEYGTTIRLNTETGESEIMDPAPQQKEYVPAGLWTQLKSAWDKYLKGLGLGQSEAINKENRKRIDDIMQQLEEGKAEVQRAKKDDENA